MGRVVAVILLAAFLLFALMLASTPGDAQSEPSASPVRPVETCSTVGARKFNKALKIRRNLGGPKPRRFASSPVCIRPDYRRVQAQIKRLRKREARRLATDPHYAIPRAFADEGIAWRTPEAFRVARCESTLNRFARNSGGYSGLFQLGSHHFFRLRGKPWFHAYANARAAAEIVAHDGSWRQWSCKPF